MNNEFPLDIEQLTAAACDGTLSAEGVGLLESLLQGSDQAQQFFLAYFRLDAELADHWQSERSLGVLEQVERAYLDDDRITWRQRAWDFIAHPTPLSLLVAGLFVTSFVLSLALIPGPGWKNSSGLFNDQSAPFVARIVRTRSASWSAASDVVPNRVYDLMLGQRIELLDGVAEIEFDRGATATIRGPAVFTIDGENGCTLERGELSAVVPPRAKNFVVATRNATIVDIGTEFGIRAAPFEETMIGCFDGKIEVRLSTSASGQQDRRIMSAGQSLVVSADGRSAREPSGTTDRLAQRVSLHLPPLEVIAETDFATIAPRGPRAEDVEWTVAGVAPPPAMMVQAARECAADSETQLVLFATEPARGHFVPERNLHRDGGWRTAVTLTPTAEVAVQRLQIDFRQFNNVGEFQPEIEREVYFSVVMIDPANGQELATATYRTERMQGAAILDFGHPIPLGGPVDLVICAYGGGQGTNMGIDSLSVLGRLPGPGRQP